MIDCKDYKDPVDVKDVEAFIAMIDDLGVTKGAIVSASGFSQAAIQRAKDALIYTYELLATGDHPWAKLLAIPAVIRDVKIDNCSFHFEMTGAGVAIPIQDWRFLKLYRANGQFIDNALNLFIDQWNKRLIDAAPGTHLRQRFSDIETFAVSADNELFKLDVYANYTVSQELRIGQIPLKDARGFFNPQSGQTVTRSFTTETFDVSTIGENWEVVPSLDNRAVQPILIMTRYLPRSRVEFPAVEDSRSPERND